ncbi:hypothetical protein BGX21_002642 [Mortierella sp. AD011]|nr:hypothetical protein BGX20_002482 [Mortierella sp. AD010]KAF9379399.1 hypothetical protein BGX21_002642 [Mortierella sp. AD011]
MSKRPLKPSSLTPDELEQEHEERRQYINQNASHMEFKRLAQEFFTKFDLQNKSAAYNSFYSSLIESEFQDLAKEMKTKDFKAWMTTLFIENKKTKKLDFQKVLERHQSQLKTAGVIKGSRVIKEGMELLVPEKSPTMQASSESGGSRQLTEKDSTIQMEHRFRKSPRLTDDSQGESSDGTASPSVSLLKRRTATQNRAGNNSDNGKETKDSISSPALIPAPAQTPKEVDPTEFPDPTQNLEHFATLGQSTTWNVDGTNMTQKFCEFRPENLGPFSLVRDGIADLTHDSTFARALDSRLISIARRVDPPPDIHERWPSLGPIYGRVFISNSYDEVVLRQIEVPEGLNEREGFADLTWAFIRGALTLSGIESRFLEVLVSGVDTRKNYNKNLLFDSKEQGQMADGLAFSGASQIYVAEASQISDAKPDKRLEDEFKVKREMRDSWVSQIHSICRDSHPINGIAVFGSSSFEDETKFYMLDFASVFRIRQIQSMVIPLTKEEFAKKAMTCVTCCLELSLVLKQELERRKDAKVATFSEREALVEACRLISQTTRTPRKPSKPRGKSRDL